MVKTCILFHVLILVLFLTVQASSINDKTSSSKFYKRFLGSKRGDTVEGLEQVRKYLSKYGYIGPSMDGRYQRSLHTFNDSNVFDHDLKKGIKKFQLFFKLNVSGILDKETLSIMVKPRCKFPDFVNGTPIKHGMKLVWNPINSSYYAFLQTKWPKSKYKLTWLAHSTTRSDAIEPLSLAFKSWQDDSVFNFKRASSFSSADVKITFYSGDPFEEKELANSYPPPSGKLDFNADIPWAIQSQPHAMDIESVAVHEIGHILGLAHSEDIDAIMWPYLDWGVVKRVLNFDDILGITMLYN
ncbi:metalloendoproteinase 2-MMP-like [Impatiens glandulifera]|uniref:metalloendoproteinase 2-MMP-like n=1 Tax=Impatiens glandulifera TaxID=253017 RepID=UPI001FB04D07|nr:metalloendoproteinase 2-MMP-like [Impatiens glandulifera]